jgi:2,3-bisphosphoglycerate-independent phosphoglycerate mutase
VKTILLVLDGLGDRPQLQLNGKTPLEAAYTPNLDALCQRAETGIMIPWRQGIPMGTEAAHFLLLGYDMSDFPGRGIVNALSRGFHLMEDAVYLATSWAWVEERDGLFICERWTKDLSRSEIQSLSSVLPGFIEDFHFNWEYSVGPHGILTLTGDRVSHSISDSDPFYEASYVMEVEAFDTDTIEAKATAEALNHYLRKCYQVLKDHPINKERIQFSKQPANFLLTKWAGKNITLPNFESMHGMTSCIIGSSLLLYGLARLLEMDYISCENFGEGIKKALQVKADFVLLHTKEPDEAAHTKNPDNKVHALEEIDKKLAPLLEQKDLLLIVTGDHTTPSSGSMIHSGEPVPIMFVGENVRVDSIKEFGERSCTQGSIRMQGADLMPMVLNFTDRALFYNFRPGSRKIGFIPSNIKKLL